METYRSDLWDASTQKEALEETPNMNSHKHNGPTIPGDTPSPLPRSGDANAPTAFLYRPARNPMQSGPRSRKWVLQLEPQTPLELEPLMGWTSGSDPARQVRLPFPSREAALCFGEAQGWQLYVLPDNERKPVHKSYRDQIATWKPAKKEDAETNGASEKGRFEAAPIDRYADTKASRGDDNRLADRLDDLLEETFPASDPLPLWSGRIGPPAGGDRTTA